VSRTGAPRRLVAFLRAINVGGHRVAMAELREVFERLGFGGVETFIASGNVIFEAPGGDRRRLVPRIERELEARLGYEVHAFLRTPEEIAAVARAAPFGAGLLANAQALNVGFLAAPLSPAQIEWLDDLASPVDHFAADGPHVYWLCAIRQSESRFSNVRFERSVGAVATFRGIATVRKLAARLGPTPSG